MRSLSRRVALAAACVLFAALFVAPLSVYASDPASLAPISVQEAGSVEPAPSTDVVEPGDLPADARGGAADSAESTPATAPESEETSAVPAVAGVQYTSQANPDTRQSIELILKTRKRQFDSVAGDLQRSIDQVSLIIRRLDAADVNVTAARARLAEARTALERAKAAERITIARYRSVLNSENEADAYARARAAARTSSAQLERARIKVLTATKTLRAIVKNVTIQNVGASTDST